MNAASVNGAGAYASRLPHPAKERWQPLRSGFVDVYKYDREEFHYENGRLLLRGNNGTGKSRVLALQLPFLLEGDSSPHRVEPDADQAKRIEWNLLMGRYPERTGYTWIEFGRRSSDGTDHYLSLGCGMTAIEGRSGVQKWFFITDQRIGVDLQLENAVRQTLVRDRLHDAIGNRGQVFTTAQSYRQAVDQHLFRLGEYRFTTLMNLLVRLRRPQLTRQFNEDELSEILSEALPPVAANILADVSEAFRSLESDRLQLESFIAANEAVTAFLKDYLRYIQVAARRRADLVRDQQSLYENRLRQIRVEEVNQRATLGAIEELTSRIQELESEATAIETEIATLLASPHMKDAETLDRAEKEVHQRTQEKQSANQALERLMTGRRLADERWQSAARALECSRNDVMAGTSRSAGAAGVVLLLDDFNETIAPLTLPEAPEAGFVSEVQKRMEQAADLQARKFETLRGLNEAVKKVEDLFAIASREEARFRGLLDEAMEAHRGLHDDLGRSSVALASSYRQWAAALRELHLVRDTETLIQALELWFETLDGVNPADQAIRMAQQDALHKIAASRAQTEHDMKSVSHALAELRLEHERLRTGQHSPPPVPHTRDVHARMDQLGAPLWLVCDFIEGLDTASRAGFEAALESAGLLDAWITPDGKLFEQNVHDAILTVGNSPLPAASAHLGCVLKPSIDIDDVRAASVPVTIVAEILRHIGSGPESGLVWVAATGQWRVGPITGTWMKAEAAHIGHGAREINRKRRMAQIVVEIQTLEGAVHSLQAILNALLDRDRIVRREVESAPSDEPMRKLHAEIDAAIRAVENFRNQLGSAEARTAECRRERGAALDRRDQAAHDLGLMEWVDRLHEIERALPAYRLSLAELFGKIRLLLAHREQSTRAQEELAAASEREDQHEKLSRQCDLDLTAALSQRDTLKKTVGAAVEQITAQLKDARKKRDGNKRHTDAAFEKRNDAKGKLAATKEALRLHSIELESDTRTRDEAVLHFKSFAETRLLHLAVPILNDSAAQTWSITRCVEAARETISALVHLEVGESSWERLQKGVSMKYAELIQQLHSHECRTSGTWCGDIFIAAVSYGAQERTIEELRDWLAHEVSTRKELLAAREREVLENHLIGDVADHLNDLLHRGEALVDDMNAELESRPTSTGMKLRFIWRIRDDQAGMAEARRILMRMSGAWTPAERQIAGGFLQSRIQAERTAAEAASWQESLGLALDYRKWHMFGVERHQDGKWKLLNKRTHGTGSGGEKAIALTLPQFAAAAAYYRSADPLAPRLILLDEAFVGIDTDMRAKCMGFIEAFDLDFMMTSEREWACYASLPGVAIYQLSARAGIDAVGLTRWVWNGEEKILDSRES